MIELKKWLKSTTLFFITIMMLQSCVAYQSTPVSLEVAASEVKRTKIITTSKKKYYYKRITFEEGQFYGFEKLNGNMVKIPIDSNEIVNVYIKSKSKSTWATIAIIVVPLFALSILAVVETNKSFENNLFLVNKKVSGL